VLILLQSIDRPDVLYTEGSAFSVRIIGEYMSIHDIAVHKDRSNI
jgi:hypothetical protein